MTGAPRAGAYSNAALRDRIGHPVIDGDAHVLELGPVFINYVREVGGDIARHFDPFSGVPFENLHRTHHVEPGARGKAATRRPVPPWWVEASNTVDWASAAAPALLYSRLDEIGFDFVVLYPTIGISLLHASTDEIRQVACRAYNNWAADAFGEFSDRLRPVALVPMHTPAEALDEIEHIEALGLGAVLIPSYVWRVGRPDQDVPGWLDVFALDAEQDYDTVWARYETLGLAVTAHSPGMGWPDRASPTNFSFNHIGHFSASGELLAKALFFGGVTRRFPRLRFAFLEGGVATACRMYADLVSHWRRRGPAGIVELDPRGIDVDEIMSLLGQHDQTDGSCYPDDIRQSLERRRAAVALQDDFGAAAIESIEDLGRRFVSPFFFGAEADDPLTSWAFARTINPGGAALQVFFGSDIGHWDVRDFREPLVEAYEQVERGLIGPEDFRAFVFGNALDLYGGHPGFFSRAPFAAGHGQSPSKGQEVRNAG